jgi:hypothetical protein
MYSRAINGQKLKSWNDFITESTKENLWNLVYKVSRNKLLIEKINELVDENEELICLGQRVELFQMFRSNRTVTCYESNYGLNASSVINCAPN